MMTRRSRVWSGLAIERLEMRRTPSRATEAVVGVGPPADSSMPIRPDFTTTPADGASIEAADAPSALIFHLGKSASAVWSDDSVALRRVNLDGTETTVAGGGDSLRATFDSQGTVTLALPSKLEAGRYRIVILGGSGMAFAFSRGRWDPTEDGTVAVFDVKAPAATIDLGVVGRDVQGPTGSLDGSAAASEAYRIRLDDGPAQWRLALQLDAGRIGSGLVAGLKVFDAAGREVASVPVGSGLQADHPYDPYVFLELVPGDYVVVVSKAADQPGGRFRLALAADPDVGSTRISSFRLERSGAGVTGFTIDFTSPIDPASLRSDVVQVVDAFGSTYAVKLTAVAKGLTGARFQLFAALPAGDYRLMIAGERPLADLLGRTPIAGGLPTGTLASWSVSADEAGPAFESAAAGPVASGSLDAAPGSVVEIPVVLRAGESLVLKTRRTSGAFKVEVIGGADGPSAVKMGTTSPSTELLIRPGAGAFLVRIISVGKSTLTGSWSLTSAAVSDESLVAGAIGSGGAIGLRLGEGTLPSQPSSASGPTTSPSGPPTPTSPVAPSTGDLQTGTATYGATVVAAAARSELGPSPWAYGAGSTLIGRPSAMGDAVATVGPTTPGGLSAVAWAVADASSLGTSLILGTGRQADDGVARGPDGWPESPETMPARDDEIARATVESDADAGALEQAEQIADAVLGGLRWLIDRAEESASAPAGDVGVIAQPVAVRPAPEGSDGKVQKSALDLPFTVLLVTASTFHLRRAARRWWNKQKLATDPAGRARPSSPKTLFRGPRLMPNDRAAVRQPGPRRG